MSETQQKLTIDGKVIPAYLVEKIPYSLTDQGRAEGVKPEDAWAGEIKMGRDELGGVMDRRASAMEPWESVDPTQELLERYIKPGQRGRLLSDGIIQRRGMRGWQPLIEGGNPVRLGNMTLATMPEERAQKREAYFSRVTAEQMADAEGKVLEQQERLSSEAGDGVSVLHSGEMVRDHETGEVAHIGLQSTRGNSAGNLP